MSFEESEIRKWLQVAFDQGSVLKAITAIREKSSTTIAYGTGQTKRLVGQEVHLGRYLIILEKRQRKWIIIEHASFNTHPANSPMSHASKCNGDVKTAIRSKA